MVFSQKTRAQIFELKRRLAALPDVKIKIITAAAGFNVIL